MGRSPERSRAGTRARVKPVDNLPDSAVFDSNILIDFLNARPPARSVFAAVTARYVSVVTRSEILAGCRDERSRAAAHTVLAACLMCDVTVSIADRAAVIRQDYRLKLPDALVAATAGDLGLPLLTRDAAMTLLPGVVLPYRL